MGALKRCGKELTQKRENVDPLFCVPIHGVFLNLAGGFNVDGFTPD